MNSCVHPWETVPLSDYEAHMSLDEVYQLQTLDQITRRQLDAYEVSSVTILGVAGGNGLSHINPARIMRVYGVDVNREYLDVCQRRYAHLGECLKLLCCDLSSADTCLPQTDLVIANLLIEYVGIETFVRHMKAAGPRYVSCVIQQSLGEQFVSRSPYADKFQAISALHRDIDEHALSAAMRDISYTGILREVIKLPNAKQFIRLDYRKH